MRLTTLIAVLFLADALPMPAVATTAAGEDISVQYAVLFDDDDPITGSSTCRVGETCVLLKQIGPELELSVTISGRYGGSFSELTVRCRADCSFANGRAAARFHGDGEFDVFEGEDGMAIPLVLKPREKIGRILLSFR